MSQVTTRLLERLRLYLSAENKTVSQKRAYFERFRRMYSIMLDASGAPLEFFQDIDYAALSFDDLVWISDELAAVPNAEDGQTVIEDVSREDVWRDAFLKGEGEGIQLSVALIQRLPAVRDDEMYF